MPDFSLPVIVLLVDSSSHCREASAVKLVTTVALVNASNAAAACNNPTAALTSLFATFFPARRCGMKERMRRERAQVVIPRLTKAGSPIMRVARRTYPPWRRAENIPMSPRRRPFWVLFQSRTVGEHEFMGIRWWEGRGLTVKGEEGERKLDARKEAEERKVQTSELFEKELALAQR